MTNLCWSLAPKQPGRWAIIDTDGMEVRAEVYPFMDEVSIVARIWKWPGTYSRLFDPEQIQSFATTDTAKRWCEQQLGLPQCEDA